MWWLTVNGLLTAYWMRLIWRLFHPPQSKPMGWAFWHLYWTALLGVNVLLLWIHLFLVYWTAKPTS